MCDSCPCAGGEVAAIGKDSVFGEVPAIEQVPAVEEAAATNKEEEPEADKKPEEDKKPLLAIDVPRVGVTALIQNKDGKFLLSKRKGSHGAGTWQFPGGHLELTEDIFECAERETLEETALEVEAKGVATFTSELYQWENEKDEKVREGKKDKRYITIFVKCVMLNPDAEPQHLEVNKCEGWHWKSWEEIKAIGEAAELDPSSTETLFMPIINLIKQEPDINKLYESKGL